MDNYEIYIRGIKRKQRLQAISPYLPFILFTATVFTTLFAGAWMQYIHPYAILKHPRLLLRGAPFAFPLMIILLTHEMGHYFTSRVHRVKATLPYFIPFPNYIGTFGAVIKMKSPMRDNRSLLDIGAAGPIAGFILSIVAVAYGLAHAEAISIDKLPPDSFWTPRIAFGPNLAFAALMKWFGPIEAYSHGNIIVNPIMDAGWLGMFVTSLNLMPAGQLDGGHISYALLGEKWARRLARFIVGALIVIGLPGFLAVFMPVDMMLLPLWPGYAVWGVLILVIGLGHPPPMNPNVPLEKGRKLIGLLCLALWVVTFTPFPFVMF